MALLSSPLTQMQPHYDVIVVGSGYGGAIAASLLSRARRGDGSPVRVGLLERGKEIALGAFPKNPLQAAKEFQVTAPEAQLGKEDALYWLHAGKDISVFHGCGLGGTSLVNANVSLPPEQRVWQDPRWPRALVADLNDGVKQGFARAQYMLRPTPYPGEPPLKKYAALSRSAQALGAPVYHPPINVTFKAGINHVGLEQPACDGCGDCVSGCNSGAKNTLMMNYLPDAKNHGAELFCGVRVLRVARARGGWNVYFQPVGCDREKFHGEPLFVSAGFVILGAGALGSTEILLRSGQAGLATSSRVGAHFSGNGDVLGFAYNSNDAINGIGNGLHAVLQANAPGPCITGIIDCRNTDRPEDAHVIEEGVIPGAIGPILAGPMKLVAELTGTDTDHGVWDEIRERTNAWRSELPGGEYHGAMRNTQTFLLMARDNASGTVVLDQDRPRVAWPGVGASPQFQRLHARLVEATAALGGTYVPSPIFNSAFNYDLITVHALGGCSMADDATSGATNHKGQVFSSQQGDDAYDSLYVSDGAALPCAVGVNPLLTISALAERNIRLLAQEQGWAVDDSRPDGPARFDGRPDGAPAKTLSFTEKMAGHVSLTLRGADKYLAAAADGELNHSPCHFVLSISSHNPEALLTAADHPAEIVGTVLAPKLSSEALTVTRGVFNLFVADEKDKKLQRMRYRMELRSVEGETFYFDGFKLIRDDAGVDVWADTTTLYVCIYRGRDATGPQVAQGILRIVPEDFAVQLTTMKGTNEHGEPDPALLVRFAALFSRSLTTAYGHKLG